MSEALKPCPFCGGGAVISADMNAYPVAACDACGASVSGRGVDGVVNAWNTRADLVEAAVKRALLFAESEMRKHQLSSSKGDWAEGNNSGVRACAAQCRSIASNPEAIAKIIKGAT